MSLIETILSIFLIPSQCNTSGINAWKRISLTPAMSSVDLKYLSAESPPRLRRLYTRYLTDSSQIRVAPWIKDLLGDFSKSSTLLAEVNDDANTTALSATDTFFNGEDEIGLAGTNVGSKDIRSITCQMDKTRSSWGRSREGDIHSSCTRSVSSLDSSAIYSGGPTVARSATIIARILDTHRCRQSSFQLEEGRL